VFTERASVVRQTRKQGKHDLLAGVGDVHARKAATLNFRKEVRQVVHRHAPQGQVNQLVGIVEPVQGGLPHMECRRLRHLDVGPNQPDADFVSEGELVGF
jgi:hypothetical protein